MARFQVLGVVQLVGPGGAVDLGGPKICCLLANLLIEPGRSIPTETLMDHVWGESQPSRSTLHRYVTRLRGTLSTAGVAPDRLREHAGSYVLDIEPESLDLHQFRTLTKGADSSVAAGDDPAAVRQLRQALDLWNEEALANVSGDWAEHVRIGLRRHRLNAVTACAQAELRQGRHAQVLDELVTLVTRHPDEEPLAAALMLAHVRCGQHAEAIRRYHMTRQHLVDELGTEPGPELRELFHRLLRQDDEPGRRSRSGTTGPAIEEAARQRESGGYRRHRPRAVPEEHDPRPDDDPESPDNPAAGHRSAGSYNSFHGPTVIHGDFVGRDKIVRPHRS